MVLYGSARVAWYWYWTNLGTLVSGKIDEYPEKVRRGQIFYYYYYYY